MNTFPGIPGKYENAYRLFSSETVKVDLLALDCVEDVLYKQPSPGEMTVLTDSRVTDTVIPETGFRYDDQAQSKKFLFSHDLL